MRTSIRPRSAGSSRISKRLLPLFADAAISMARPLKGTAPLVEAVTVNCDVATGAAEADGSCGWIAPDDCTPASDALIRVCPASAADGRPLPAPLAAGARAGV